MLRRPKKIKKILKKKQKRVKEVEEQKAKSTGKAADDPDYDSMIDNGSSEASDESGDDGPSNKEQSKRPLVLAPAGSKRKAETGKGNPFTPIKEVAKRVKGEEKVKPPTLEEINELKETRNLFHSNLFRLQIKEMLNELKVKQKYKNYVERWLENFKSFIKSLKSQSDKEDVDKLQWLQRSPLKMPLALSQLQVQKQKLFKFQFIKPSSEARLLGSAAIETIMAGAQYVVDVEVRMPADCFQKENYLNLIYDQKRALYLTYIAKEIMESSSFEDVNKDSMKFSYFGNNPLKPVLELRPPSSMGSLAQKLVFRLFVAAEEQSFKLSRFVPWNSNIRSSLFRAEHDEAGADGTEDDEANIPFATPNYNANVLFDLTSHSNQQLLHATFDNKTNFQQGLILLKVWLYQREFNKGFSGFNGHMMAMFIVYLSRQGKLHANMSSYQVARTVWNQLAHSCWDEDSKGISLCDAPTLAPNQPTLEQFHAHYEVVFVDATGFYNICSNLSGEMYRHIRTEAKLAVDLLNDMKLNSFQYLFMTKCPLYLQFDHILKLNKADVVEQILEMHVPPHVKHNYAGYAYPQLFKVVTDLIRKGLGNRVYSLTPLEMPSESWCVREAPKGCADYLHLGIKLNPDEAYDVLIKGPESIAEGASDFRKFWGDKAQLRRFQDGSITESVVWAKASDALAKKRLIVRSIVMHLLQHHFQLDEQDVDYVAGEFDVVYRLNSAFKTETMLEHYKVEQDTDAEMLSLRVIHSFDDLARKLHSLKELPLEIVSIAGTSPVFRYCDPVPILQLARSIGDNFVAPSVHHGVIQLGLSGKWPSELEALRALKVAFYIQIAKLLREKHKLKVKVTYDGLLVLKQGYCYQIEMAHPKELSLLKKEVTEKGITQYVDSEQSRALEKRLYILPKVTGALHALYQLQPSYGPAVMIAKRWLHAQLIDDGMWPDECTELLIASQYLHTHSKQQQQICTPQMGFVRFLHLLAHTDWKTQMFLVNFNKAMDENEISDLEHRFNTERDSFPPLCIITSMDQKHQGMLWSTKTLPNENVIVRVTLLARQALAILEPPLLAPLQRFIKPSRLFIASNQGYDLVIQLKPDLVCNAFCTEFGSPFVAFTKPNWRLPLAGTNFTKQAVNKLREAYSDYAAFFYNPDGGKEIGIVWKPEVFCAKEFKVNDVNACAPVSREVSNTKVKCHQEVLIEDFKFILKDFHLRIDTVQALAKGSAEAMQQKAPVVRKDRYFNKVPEEHDQAGKGPKIAVGRKGQVVKKSLKDPVSKKKSLKKTREGKISSKLSPAKVNGKLAPKSNVKRKKAK